MESSKILVLFFCFFVLYIEAIVGQNLVPNGDFEEFKSSSKLNPHKKINDLAGNWEAFSNTSIEGNKPRISICGNCSSTPDDIVHIFYNNFNTENGKEYKKKVFQVPLIQELKKDSIYCLSFLYNILFVLKFKIDSTIDSRAVQFYTSDFKINSINDLKLLNNDWLVGILPQGTTTLSYQGGKSQYASSVFKARGGEKYLMFGTFEPKYLKYFYSISFDNIQLTRMEPTTFYISETKVGSSFVMENILFETNKSILKESSFKPLNLLISELNKNPKLKLEISGHTDNVGNFDYNQQLSGQRAKAVVDYLDKQGIEKERLNYKGYGSSKPIADNESELGRNKNRRVEVTIIDK
jgi:outer membrane protein OmpA-like peptidoglycan-associated protein